MANHASAIKRHKQSEKRRLKNASVKSAIRTVVKKVKDSAEAGKMDEAKVELKNAISALDKAVTKGVIHRNNASRKISRLTSGLNAKTGK